MTGDLELKLGGPEQLYTDGLERRCHSAGGWGGFSPGDNRAERLNENIASELPRGHDTHAYDYTQLFLWIVQLLSGSMKEDHIMPRSLSIIPV